MTSVHLFKKIKFDITLYLNSIVFMCGLMKFNLMECFSDVLEYCVFPFLNFLLF